MDSNIVVMDIHMPVMDGLEAFEFLKNKNYQTPIIALTARAMLEDKKRTRQLGFVAHITKPIDPVELIGSINTFARQDRGLKSGAPG